MSRVNTTIIEALSVAATEGQKNPAKNQTKGAGASSCAFNSSGRQFDTLSQEVTWKKWSADLRGLGISNEKGERGTVRGSGSTRQAGKVPGSSNIQRCRNADVS